METSKLRASDGATQDRFGSAVAFDGDTALVAAYNDDGGTGAVYVFERTGPSWVETAKLIASDGAPQAYFGTSVSLDGDTVLIGAPWAAGVSQGTSGAAYVFERTPGGWVETDKLFMTPSWSGYGFGQSVSLDDETALIGVESGHGAVSHSGTAQVFVKGVSGWVLTDTLFLAFFSWGLCACLWAVRSQRKIGLLVASGACFGLAFLTRPLLMFFPYLLLPALSVLLWSAGGLRWRAAIFLAAIPAALLGATLGSRLATMYLQTGTPVIATQVGNHSVARRPKSASRVATYLPS